jgi:hypothetical protein
MIGKGKKSFDENGIFIPFPQVASHGMPQAVALPERFVSPGRRKPEHWLPPQPPSRF